jgi:TM2 domain-containing membrane protein YozV
MNCAVHTDVPAAAYCRTCGKALCENCKRDVMGAIYCEPCIAVRLHGTQPAAAIPVAPVVITNTPSPGVAMLLGFIPGVGAMYNGQFLKGFIHVAIFVLLIMAANNISDYFGLLIAFFVIYMPFDAYKTAEAKRLGLPLPDPLGLDRLFGMQESQQTPASAAASGAAAVPPGTASAGSTTATNTAVAPPTARADQIPISAIVLIGLGVLFLLGNIIHENIFHHFWPLILIGIGLWLAYKRMAVRT